ncbi:MPN domain-containing protein CG4751 isoform X2 [Bactrocera dorsalis]|nr:MPN domain-containing protein CG4751 isoform X2 [Bactrocera dorsalis]XP_049318341.1 MPN domain-containing protein CG4751 isoform X2 [Bactrocera dorsalis]XP_049318342.1 MPN domain-containing protein CG4751 isoform X2 [Bactrocera dorsalis]XP_049318343.1 MPN domain-containing protein CG4751 isoform X2 [Bactrocera dorsalis]
MSANVLQPGKAVMTIDYLGQKFVGDLMPDGKIKSQETETLFLTPSAWAVHCKRFINPEKKSGCGWASVKYKGKKLDVYKNSWLRKCALQKDVNLDDSESEADKKSDCLLPNIKRNICSYNTIMNRNLPHDGNMLIKAVSFISMGKVQPFLITFNSSALLLVDFHCHLTMREVCGYFGGHWDINTHTLNITKTYPCRNIQKSVQEEKHIKNMIMCDQLLLVGWYHSHPKFQAEPSLRDCDAQLDFQIRMRGSSDTTYTPCVSAIVSPYYDENPSLESVIKSIWVMPPNETKQVLEYGRPMLMQYSVILDKEAPAYVHSELQACATYYAKSRNELIKFNSIFIEDVTFLEKLKHTLYLKLPAEQDNTTFWNWICEILGCGNEGKFVPPKTMTHIGNKCKHSSSVEYSVDLPQHEIKQLIYDKKFVEIEKHDLDRKGSEIKVLSLQEQLCLPSGLNMNPVRTFASLTSSSQLGSKNIQSLTTKSTNVSSNQTSTSSMVTTLSSEMLSPLPTIGSALPTVSFTEIHLHDSPITVPSCSASPVKSEIPVLSSPSPTKSETPLYSQHSNSTTLLNSRNQNILNMTSNYEIPNESQTQSTEYHSTTNDLVAASLAHLADQLAPSFIQNDLTNIFQQHSADKNNRSSTNDQIISEKSGEQKDNSCETVVSGYIKNFNVSRSLGTQNQETAGSTKNKAEPSRLSSPVLFSSNNTSLYKTKLMKELDNIKNDPLKMNELMRSPEYAALLLHQAEALGATTLGTLGLGSDLNFLTGTTLGSKTDQTQTPDYNNLAQVSKFLGYETCMQLTKADDFSAFIQQQMGAVAAAALVNVSLSSKKQKQSESQVQTDYGSLLQTYSKLFENENNFRCGAVAGKSLNNQHNELSALLSVGADTDLPSFDSKLKTKDVSSQIQQKQSENQNQTDNSFFYHQNKAVSHLSSLFAPSTPTANLSSSNKLCNSTNSTNMTAIADSPSFFNAFSQEKAQEYAFFQQQHIKQDENFFLSPATMLKLQKDSLSAMMMKPPKSTSSTLATISRSREASTSTVLSPIKDGSANSMKYNYSAIDLAVSSIQSNTSAPISVEASNNLMPKRRPSNTPPVDLSRLYSEGQSSSVIGSLKKRMEFSSIAELAAPPPTKISKELN